jgi:coenzyme F420-0:L-glutamate ligase / coenzyme F420-1:gamma-L-glutamate ligase
MTVEIEAPAGVGEIQAGDDLAALLLHHLRLLEGDIVVITSKVVSKAEGRVFSGPGAQALPGETERVLARKGPITIVRSRLGITQAMAGIDSSNVPADSHALLPVDPDASARAIRRTVYDRTSTNIGVLISDTAGRAWRVGQIEIAIGAAGVRLTEDYLGHDDGYGNVLAHTLPCVADQLCGAAELAQGKTGRRPLARLRGRADLVLGPRDDGPGATSLNRPVHEDLFGFGAREAVVRAAAAATSGETGDVAAFGSPASAAELLATLRPHCLSVSADLNSDVMTAHVRAGLSPLVTALAFAHGWVQQDSTVAADPTADSRQLRLVRVSP